MSYVNGPICATTNSNGDPCSTIRTCYISTDGDTLRIITPRAPANNATGLIGEICIGTVGGTTYLYYCTAVNTWQRVAFATF